MRSAVRRCGALILVSCLLATACRHPGDELRAFVPDLEPDLAAHLTRDDPGELRAFARSTGRVRLARLSPKLIAAPPTTSSAAFLRAETAIAPYQRRLVEVLESEFHHGTCRLTQDAYELHPLQERIEIVALLQESSRLNTDPTLSAVDRAVRLSDLIQRSSRFQDVLNFADLYGTYASLLPELGRRAEIPGHLQRGIEVALQFRDFAMACQLLGTLGYFYQQAGEFEAMRECWDRALTYARREDSWQEARILSFYAAFYRSAGHLAITRDLLMEAQDRCRELGASEIELRFVIDALSFFARLECWDVVERGVRRADLVLGESRGQLSPLDVELEETRLQVMRACHQASLGRRDESQRMALEAAARARRWGLGPQRTIAIHLGAARALMMCGLVSDARPLLEESLEQCLKVPVEERVDEATNALAAAYLKLGALDSCSAILARRPPPAAGSDAVQRAVLEIGLEIARGDRGAAFEKLLAALAMQDQWLAAAGSSVENEIALASHDELRQLGHDLLAASPEAGYAFEMRWRMPMRDGRRFPPATSGSTFLDMLARSARSDCARLKARNAVHYVYDVREDRIVRFTATPTGVSRETLAADPDSIRSQVEAVCDRSARSAGCVEPAVDGSPAGPFSRLGRALLPPDVVRAQGPRLVLFTANGWMAKLPFETLVADSLQCLPLLALRDVARVRYWTRSTRNPASDSAIVVSQPSLSGSLRRRYSILSEPLPGSAAEAEYVRSLLPRSISLVGEAATKRNLLCRWEGVRLLYFAGHVIQDPEVPWVSFIPMAQGADRHEDDSYLEASDVRDADLSRCRIAVLSSCASGAPYAEGRVSASSLADAFLDAGVQAVVSTGWAVPDAAADRTMRAFMREIVTGADPIQALCAVRRKMAQELADPHAWAAYTISITRLPSLDAHAIGPLAVRSEIAAPLETVSTPLRSHR